MNLFAIAVRFNSSSFASPYKKRIQPKCGLCQHKLWQNRWFGPPRKISLEWKCAGGRGSVAWLAVSELVGEGAWLTKPWSCCNSFEVVGFQWGAYKVSEVVQCRCWLLYHAAQRSQGDLGNNIDPFSLSSNRKQNVGDNE